MDYALIWTELIMIGTAFLSSFLFTNLFFKASTRKTSVIFYGAIAGYLGKYLMDSYGLFVFSAGSWDWLIMILKVVFATGLFVFVLYEITRNRAKEI